MTPTKPPAFVLIAKLTVRRAATAQFHDFERRAATILRRHTGNIDRVIAIRGSDPDHFVEVHVVSFAAEAGFHSYRNDPELTSLADLRAAAIVATEVLLGDEAPGYHEDSATKTA